MTLSQSSNQSNNETEIKPSLPDKSQANAALQHNPQSPEVRESQQISLYSEKLQIDRRQRKVGEVVIRKQVETGMIQVPVRQEKLIVEQIGENPQQLAEVVIKEEKVNGFTLEDLGENKTLHITKSHFLTLETAQNLLEVIADLSSATEAKIRLEIVTNCSEQQIEHQSICDRYP